jgi:hypothetical protein
MALRREFADQIALTCAGRPASAPGQGERRESATDVRLDGDETAADADDGDALHTSSSYMRERSARWCHATLSPSPALASPEGGRYGPIRPPWADGVDASASRTS